MRVFCNNLSGGKDAATCGGPTKFHGHTSDGEHDLYKCLVCGRLVVTCDQSDHER